jgi:hypothetical protein
VQTTTRKTTSPTDGDGRALVLDARGRLYEVDPAVLEGAEIDPSRIAAIAASLPRDADGSLQLPSWIDAAGLEAEVEAQGQAANLAAAVLLGLAGCAGPSGGLRVEDTGSECVEVATVDDELGTETRAASCEPSLELDLPAGGHDVRVADDEGLVYQGRVYVRPGVEGPLNVDVTPHWPAPAAPAAEPTEPNGAVEAPAVVTGIVRDHAGPTSGHVEVREPDGALIAEGRLGAPLEVPPGTALVTLIPDGFADDAEHVRRVSFASNQAVRVEAEIPSGILEVRVREGGEPVFATVYLLRDGQEVGTVGSHVPWKASAGTYDVRVVSRGEAQLVEDVHLEPGQRRAVRVDF